MLLGGCAEGDGVRPDAVLPGAGVRSGEVDPGEQHLGHAVQEGVLVRDEGIWSLLRRGPLANVAFTDDDHLERTLRRGLRHIQHRPDLIDGCLSGTRLTLTRHPTTNRRDQ
ncbi:hypothetical protein GCM10010094_78430 [Streptomyces flaveus]|uniref:Uncharacterized protein n=1 Tax=Streptomyces flaveus TaxID=66370 RepID=A0A917RFY7_9ACTN|nr:hypothetical protein GCM10010094_78430 [Streptomyces flaveus]